MISLPSGFYTVTGLFTCCRYQRVTGPFVSDCALWLEEENKKKVDRNQKKRRYTMKVGGADDKDQDDCSHDYSDHPFWSAETGAILLFVDTVVARGLHEKGLDHAEELHICRLRNGKYLVTLRSLYSKDEHEMSQPEAQEALKLWMNLLGHRTVVKFQECDGQGKEVLGTRRPQHWSQELLERGK